MDATTRETRTIRLAGREMQLYVPTGDQQLAITLSQSEQFDQGERLTILRELWLDLFVDRQDRVYFVAEMARRGLAAKDLADGLAQLRKPLTEATPSEQE